MNSESEYRRAVPEFWRRRMTSGAHVWCLPATGILLLAVASRWSASNSTVNYQQYAMIQRNILGGRVNSQLLQLQAA